MYGGISAFRVPFDHKRGFLHLLGFGAQGQTERRDMKNHDQHATHDTRRINGQLHFVHHVTDEQGKVVTSVTGPMKVEFRLTDFSQLIAGAFVMALPVAVTGEVWDLGEQLSLGRILAILGISLLTLAMFVWGLFYGKHIGKYQGHFLKRVVSAYLVTFMVALLLLVLFDKAPLQDLQVTFARCVLVAFPACFAATAVDYMK